MAFKFDKHQWILLEFMGAALTLTFVWLSGIFWASINASAAIKATVPTEAAEMISYQAGFILGVLVMMSIVLWLYAAFKAHTWRDGQ
ncbi:MAG: hypothetical protein M0T81_01235 [Thermoplasmatales archaeon]|jgi:hypothetical protein|nr:hypothetical protein [Thermoplasmatales archaeon]